jgi:hypothetical protein
MLKRWVTRAPNISEKRLEKLCTEVKIAYIDPSIFLGHILAENTKTGMVLIYPMI